MGRLALSRELAEKNGLPSDRFPITQEELQKAEDILIADFASISLEERERLTFDIHGLPTLNYESDADTCKVQKLREVAKHLHALPPTKTAAYAKAYSLNPEYVQTLSERFLSAYNGDAELTADQLAQHFENKKALFCTGDCSHPEDILGRDILFSDLSAAEVHLLETSCMQMLPSRDPAGRVVIFYNFSPESLNADTSTMRYYWYFQQCLRHENATDAQGYIWISFLMGDQAQIFDLDYMESMVNNLYDGGGLKMVVEHCCCDSDDPAIKAFVQASALFSDETNRHRVRYHWGNMSEVFFKLQTYGIATHELPVTITQPSSDGDGASREQFTLKYDSHLQWLQAHRMREEDTASTASSCITIIPRQFDVLFGRGRDTRVHVGNLRAKELVDMRFEEYEKANKQGKTAIAQEIVDTILESHGRFLTRATESNGDVSHSNPDSSRTQEGWVEVDSDTARYKIAHFFRRRRNSCSGKNNKRANGAD